MPRASLAKLARQYGASVSTVEGYWRACEDAINPVQDPKTGKKGSRPGYGVVMNCVKAKLRNRKKGRSK